ncbi:carboxylesterase/lipase family protein [Amycolatopsis sp. NPDC003865]
MIVRTTSGDVRGEPIATGVRFRGIPYAAAPEGELRFAAPAPARAWDGVRDAREAGPTAPQRHRTIPGLDLSAVVGDGWRPGPEYLTVDVWTPDPGAAGLPVLVFVHGGAFIGGTGSAPVYDGTAFTRGGAVLVTVQYRLSVDGFVPLDGGATNLGLRDQLAALRWVQENIAAFGGDAGNVTLFGESAGGISVACLLGSPLSAGLFRRAVVQSGHANMVRGRAELERLAGVIAGGLGVEPTAAAFRKLPTERLLDAQDAVLKPGGGPDLRGEDGLDRSYGLSPFLPLVGDDVLPRHPGEAIRNGAGSDIDLIAGTCREEMLLYFGPTGLLDVLTDEQAVAMLSASHPDADGVLRGYGLGERKAGEVFVEAMTDLVFRDGVKELVESHRGRSFRYEFEWRAPRLGACHGMELPFVFDSLAASAGIVGDNPPAELAREVNSAWTRFAATGDPGWAAAETTHLG